tara:strand:+ start:443 stop:646 length:204 start_codon:yes stop_codon:yes gene_type:complete
MSNKLRDKMCLEVLDYLGVKQDGITKAVITFEVDAMPTVQITRYVDSLVSAKTILKKYRVEMVEDEG